MSTTRAPSKPSEFQGSNIAWINSNSLEPTITVLCNFLKQEMGDKFEAVFEWGNFCQFAFSHGSSEYILSGSDGLRRLVTGKKENGGYICNENHPGGFLDIVSGESLPDNDIGACFGLQVRVNQNLIALLDRINV